MTDRINAITVVLENDTREDDAESLIGAIKLLKGVLSVTPHVVDINDYISGERAKDELRKKILKLLY